MLVQKKISVASRRRLVRVGNRTQEDNPDQFRVYFKLLL